MRTEIFREEILTRGSFPSVYNCDDGNEYFVKHSQQNRNYSHLINEVIAGQLAIYIDIPIPSFAIVEIDETLPSTEIFFNRGRPRGLGFGSQKLPGFNKYIQTSGDLLSSFALDKIKFSNSIIEICAFDIWIANGDRTSNNTNLILNENKNTTALFVIDHGAAFEGLSYLSLENEMREPPSIGGNLIENELYNLISDINGLFFKQKISDICNKIAGTSDFVIKEIIDSVPNEWHLLSEEKMEIYNFLSVRKKMVKKFFFDLLEEIGC